MRKAAASMLVCSTLVPVGVLAVAPAGAAAGTPTCKTLKGTETFGPALPKLGSASKVHSSTVTKTTLGGCTGGGVTSAKSVSKGKYYGNCTTLLSTPKGTATKGTATLTWSNNKTSTVATTLTSVSAPAGSCTTNGLAKVNFVNQS